MCHRQLVGGMFKCPYCPREFGTRKGLSIHITKMHKEYLPRPIILPLKCTHCGVMITKRGLQRDSLLMFIVDGEKKPFHKGCYMNVYTPTRRPEVAAKVSRKLTGRPHPWMEGDKHPMKNPEVAAKQGRALRGRRRPDIQGNKNPMKRPEVAVKITGDKNPMRNPENFAKWREAMSKRPNKEESVLIPILEEFGFAYHKKIEIVRAPDFVHECERRVIEFDGGGGHCPGPPWVPKTMEECLAKDDKRDQDYRDAGYHTLRIFPEDLAEGDDFVRAKVVEWMLQ